MLFDGFLRVYEEGRDDDATDDDDKRLPQISQRRAARWTSAPSTPEQHFTQPPPRYTEATLVKRMEELGIGRPSTYASIVTTIQDREYVRKDKNRLIPEDKGRLVTAFLSNYFRKYVGYDFTADLENQLDEVSAGDATIRRCWAGSGAISRRDCRNIRSAHHRSAGEDQRGAGAASVPADGRRRRPAPVPELRQWAPVDAHRPLGRRLYRLLELSRMPLHPPLRPADPEAEHLPFRPRASCWARMPATRFASSRAALAPTCSAAKSPKRIKSRRAIHSQGLGPRRDWTAGACSCCPCPAIGPHPEDGVMVWANIGRYGPYLKHAPTTSDGRHKCQP